MNIQQQGDASSPASFPQLPLASDHPYAGLLSPIMAQLPKLLTPQTNAEPNTAVLNSNLKIYITQSQDQKLNNFLYSYTLPMSLQAYIDFSENVELQKKLDSNVAIYEVLKTLDQCTKVMYLAYKKVLFVTGRDFVYVRYALKNHQSKQYWVLGTSIPGEEQRPGSIRARIVKTVTRAMEKEGNTEIWVYSQVDMKMQMKPESTKQKGVFEIKKYVQRCYENVAGKKAPEKPIEQQVEGQKL